MCGPGTLAPEESAAIATAPTLQLQFADMQLFIDVLEPGGAYRASTAPVDVDADGIAGELILPRFLEALGYRPMRAGHRLFHVERARYIHGTVSEDIRHRHTIVVVRCIDPVLSDPSTIRALWLVTGGSARSAHGERPLRSPSDR